MLLFSITLVLFLIMDSFGNIASYLSLVGGFDKKRQRIILLREMLIALAFMVAFNYLGEFFFQQLGLSNTTVKLSSGAILFLVAIKTLFPSPDDLRSNLPKGEPFITPLAIPLIAGPSVLATIMLYADLEPSQLVMLGAIFLACAASFLVFFCASWLQRILTSNGLMAIERLMGMILMLMAVQRILEGVQQFVQTGS